MSREIKFRAWDKSINSMCDVGAIYFLAGGLKVDGTGVLLGNGWATEANGHEHDCNVSLMQYTGIHDMNGIEIYDGDIVKCIKNCLTKDGEVFHSIGFHNSGFASDSIGHSPLWNLVDGFMAEVVGNIYENPELLSGLES